MGRTSFSSSARDCCSEPRLDCWLRRCLNVVPLDRMKWGGLIGLSVAIMLPTLAMAQAKPDSSSQTAAHTATPSEKAYIVKQEVDKGDGSLRISYSDGAIVE